jgi:soluble lytic murein transglycosylase-like protein
MRFCSTIWIGALVAAAALQGGERPLAPSRITSVVKSDPRTGRLVRSVVVTPKAVAPRTVAGNLVAPRVVASGEPAPAPADEPTSGIDQAVERIAARHDLAPDLLHSVIKVESNYNPWAVSSKGALGMMQLIPATARRFGVADVFNPVENIQGGARYLRYLLDLFDGNYPLALAAYNAGEAAVAKYGGVPPYRETRNYLQLVLKQLEKKRSAKPAAPVIKKEEPARDPNAPPRIQEIVETDGARRYVSRQ